MKDFTSEGQAIDWMIKHVDDHCIDNIRVAYKDNQKEVDMYNGQKNKGCCGFYDTEVTIKGQHVLIGCNYGH